MGLSQALSGWFEETFENTQWRKVKQIIFQMNQSEAAVPLLSFSSFVGVLAAFLLGIAIFVAQFRLAGMIVGMIAGMIVYLSREKDKTYVRCYPSLCALREISYYRIIFLSFNVCLSVPIFESVQEKFFVPGPKFKCSTSILHCALLPLV